MNKSSSRRFLVTSFKNEEDILNATREFKESGYEIVDVFTPFAVHGMDEAMGLKPSRLPWICFFFGLFGAAFMVWFEYWTTAVDWPVNVGGKPYNSLPAFVPITFEAMVLLAGLSTVAALLIRSRLFPWRRPVIPSERITDDRFVLVIEERDANFVWEKAYNLCLKHNAVEVREEVKAI